MAGSSTFTWKHALALHSTLSPFDSPVPQTHSAFRDVKQVSWKRFNIAGLLVTVYGLEELPLSPGHVTVLWLMHGRGDTQDSMGYAAAGFLNAWNSTRQKTSAASRGLICVCFDQRNHGSRLVDDRANVSWKQGNPTHGPDMFATYSGTASDLSHLITHFPHYISFNDGVRTAHIAGGVSLGGHATWQAVMADPRIRAGIVVIGCPDYVRLMTDRAVRSELSSCMNTQPPGRAFLGSSDFPASLVGAVEEADPAGLLLSELDTVTGDDHRHTPSETEQRRLRPILRSRLAGKSIVCLSGGKDRLVPYEQAEPFLTWLKAAVAPGTGWCADLEIHVEDFIDPNGRHEFSGPMRKEAERWLCAYLMDDHSTVNDRDSKL